MKQAMRKGLISLITGAATVASPMAFAAQDTSGMQYTSAAEGFYASIRARYSSGGDEVDGADIQNSSSRIGIRGTNDLGGGLSGFYQYELGVGIDNGSDTSTRLGHVGLRGNFGEVVVGTFWDQTYNWTHGSTDVANVHSGKFNYSNLLPARQSAAIQYTTPDLNGFQAALRAGMDNGLDEEILTEVTANDPAAAGNQQDDYTAETRTTETEDGNDLDNWALSAKYSVQGFDVAAAYSVIPDGVVKGGVPADDAHGSGTTAGNPSEDDLTAYIFRAGYAQDNWYVNAWYAQYDDEGSWIDDTNADTDGDLQLRSQDTEIFSLAAGVAVDKVNVYGVYETRDSFVANADFVGEAEDTHAAVGVQYNLGSNSRVWIEYASQDLESDKSAEDYVTLGMRHDF